MSFGQGEQNQLLQIVVGIYLVFIGMQKTKYVMVWHLLIFRWVINMAFKDTILTFEDDKILTDDDREVMMSWEASIMEKTAEYICQSKGDILEIGFGMGICSDYIQ